MVKLLSRGNRTVREIALDLNVSCHTAKNWMKRGHPDRAGTSAGKEKRPQDWSAQEQLLALQETHVLSGEALQTWCRERGLFAHHLESGLLCCRENGFRHSGIAQPQRRKRSTQT